VFFRILEKEGISLYNMLMIQSYISLQYVDDTILFSSADLYHLLNLKHVIMWFEQILGMIVNLHKSELITMNVEEDVVIRLLTSPLQVHPKDISSKKKYTRTRSLSEGYQNTFQKSITSQKSINHSIRQHILEIYQPLQKSIQKSITYKPSEHIHEIYQPLWKSI
jgi:hypothetical protein